MSDQQQQQQGKQKGGGGNQAKPGIAISQNFSLESGSDQDIVNQGLRMSATGIIAALAGGGLIAVYFGLRRSKLIGKAIWWLTNHKVDLTGDYYKQQRGQESESNSASSGGSVFGIDRGLLSQEAQQKPEEVITQLEKLLAQAKGVSGRNKNNQTNLPVVVAEDTSDEDDNSEDDNDTEESND